MLLRSRCSSTRCRLPTIERELDLSDQTSMSRDCLAILQEVALRQAEAIEVVDGRAEISFGAFCERMLGVAAGLRAYGHRPRVAIDLRQGIDAYTVDFAVLAVEGCFCPLSPFA